MCGIIGILGKGSVAPRLLEGLARLEYRGYDSAGIATLEGRRRATGKLSNLTAHLQTAPLAGTLGIGHTRWATHGAATCENAHPHSSGPVTIVHNGIIENFRALREELTALGFSAESQTDTETVVQLTAHYLSQGLTPLAAVRQTLARIEGAFALLWIFEGQDNLMIAARKGSPLALGRGEGEMFVGSDAIALAPFTDQITYLDEGDHAVLTREGFEIFNAEGAPVQRLEARIEAGAARVEKDGYRHFMAKEIAEQPTILAQTLSHYLEGGTIALPQEVNFSALDRLTLVACGTAYYAGAVAKYWFERLAGLPCEVDVASEFRYREPPMSAKGAALFISQSGETADTLAALRYTKGKVAQVISVINVPSSSIARESDIALPIRAGVEVGVASTKAFTAQLMTLALLALKAAQDRGTLSKAEIAAHLDTLRALPNLIGTALLGQYEGIGQSLAKAQDILFLGRGEMFPLAMEGALKLKEISYIHAEGYAAGELKHGPIALIDEAVPVVVFAPSGRLFEKTLSNMQEVMARGGKVLLISDREGLQHAEGTFAQLELPHCSEAFAPILYAVSAQLLAYHTALAKGTDVDQPRNLAKSVTVE